MGAAEGKPAPIGAADRLHMLDGLRGVAALVVVAGHAQALLAPLPLTRNWLAVDLFFVMSGFVLGRVYEIRFARGMTTGRFLLNRAVRLYPLYLVGTSLGILAGVGSLMAGRNSLGGGGLALASVAALMVLPSPTWNRQEPIMPLDNPGWSLFFELVANLVFVFAWRWLWSRVLGVIALACAALLLFGLMHGTAFGGADWTGMPWGFARVGFSFSVGLLIQRFHPGVRHRGPLAWLLLPLPLLLMTIPTPFGIAYEGVCLLLLFPLLIWLAALVEPMQPRLFALLGASSYAIYVVHSPLLVMAERGLPLVGIDPARYAPWSGIAFLAAMLVLALALDRWFDVPVRRALLARLSPRPRADRGLTAADTPL